MTDGSGFTLEDANKRLPLVRVIAQDARELKTDILQRQSRLQELRGRHPREAAMDSAYAEEVLQMEESLEEDEIRLDAFSTELSAIGAHLMDAETGLVEFTSTLEGEEIRLSWLIGEVEVTHWRALGDAPASRKPLVLIGQESA